MELKDEARMWNDPVARSQFLRQKAQERYNAHRAEIDAQVRRREEAGRREAESETQFAPLVPDAWVKEDGSLHYLTDEEKRAEKQRIDKFMEERER
jgi:hypothetical protein